MKKNGWPCGNRPGQGWGQEKKSGVDSDHSAIEKPVICEVLWESSQVFFCRIPGTAQKASLELARLQEVPAEQEEPSL